MKTQHHKYFFIEWTNFHCHIFLQSIHTIIIYFLSIRSLPTIDFSHPFSTRPQFYICCQEVIARDGLCRRIQSGREKPFYLSLAVSTIDDGAAHFIFLSFISLSLTFIPVTSRLLLSLLYPFCALVGTRSLRKSSPLIKWRVTTSECSHWLYLFTMREIIQCTVY